MFWPTLIVLIAQRCRSWRGGRGRPKPTQRRRVRLFVASLVVGSLPILADVLLETPVPPFRRLMADPAARWWSGAHVFPCLLSIPFATAYAVVVHQVLDVTMVVRKVLQYALARYTVITASTVPFLWLASLLFERRHLPLGEIFSGPAPLALLLLPVAGIVTLRARHRVLEAIDRRFFREQYDSRLILTALVEQSRTADSISALSNLLSAEISGRSMFAESPFSHRTCSSISS